MKKESFKHKLGAQAGHVSEGGTHVAFVKALHVLLSKEDGGWFAQGVEIDYVASGATADEVKKNFADGLALTIDEHLKMHGHIKNILKGVPLEAFGAYIETPPDDIEELSFLTAISMFEKAKVSAPKEKAKAFPFKGLQFAGLMPEPA